jgi:predicted dehydrogenase
LVSVKGIEEKPPVTSGPKRVLIAGFGSIGKRHLAVVRARLPEAEVTVLRRPGSTEEVPGVFMTHDLDSALKTNPNFAILSGPAPFRLPLASRLVEAEVPLLLEKPLSDRYEGIDELSALVAAKKLPVQVGYCLRFEPSLAALKTALDEGRIGRPLTVCAEVGQYLPNWRPGTDYRQSVSAQKRLGGGVLLELSHEIDYLLWLFGLVKNLNARLAKISKLEIDVEDFARLDLAFNNGVMGSASLDMVQRAATRSCKIIGNEGSLIWDGIDRKTTLFEGDDDVGVVIHQSTGNTMYEAQLDHFLACLKTGQQPLVGLTEGAEVMRVIGAARRADASGKRVSI